MSKRTHFSLLALLLCFATLFSFVSCQIGSGSNNKTTVATPTTSSTQSTTGGGNASSTVKLDFYSINDMHGNVKDSDYQTGIGKLASFFSEKAEEENAIFLSAGDMWQGGVESNNTKGKLVTDWMNQVGFTAMTLGNHEFDWGTEKIKMNAELAEFPILAINVYERATSQRASYCQPSVTVEKEGVKIGIIGAVGDVYSSISASRVKDVYFKVGSELTALVKAESEKLRAEGADFIVYVLHDGYSSRTTNTSTPVSDSKLGHYDTSLSNGYVDLVFEGHTHTRNMYTDKYGVYHLQAGGENEAFAHVEVTYNKDTDSYRITENELVWTEDLYHYPIDENTLTLYEKYADEIGDPYAVLGYNAYYRSSTALKQLVAKLYLEAALEKWGEEYTIFLGGGYLNTRSPYDLEAGNVCYADLLSLFPFDNDLVLCSIKGSDLQRRYVDNDSYYTAYSAYGTQNIGSIDPNATYYVVTDTYNSDYTANRLTIVDYYSIDGIYARDLLAEYAKNGGFSK